MSRATRFAGEPFGGFWTLTTTHPPREFVTELTLSPGQQAIPAGVKAGWQWCQMQPEPSPPILMLDSAATAARPLARWRYPSTDAEQAVHLAVPYPDVPQDLNRWLPLVKWFLAIPHYVVLVVLDLAVVVVVIVAWFAILVTARYPRGLFAFVEGVLRWNNRVVAYAFILVTDQYPPFRLGA